MYAKIFQQIFDSTIADDYRLRHFFIDMLVLANSDGIVNMTPNAIAARTRIPLEEVKDFLTRLEAPDPESHTPDAEGRRIQKIDEHRNWGWYIINYVQFRLIASEEQRREKTRQRVKKFKEKLKSNGSETLGNAEGALGNVSLAPSHSPSPSSESLREGCGEGGPTLEAAYLWLKGAKSGGGDYTEAETKAAFLALSVNGWMWGKNPIVDWRAALETKINDKRDGRGGSNRPQTPMDIKTIMQAKEGIAIGLKQKHSSEVAMGTTWNNEAAKTQYFALRKEIKALQQQLGAMA